MRYTATASIVGMAMAWATIVAGAQGAGGDPAAAAVKNPVASTPESIAEGRKQYTTYCRHCHGAKGLGDGPLAPTNPSPANLTDDKWDHGSTDGEIFAVIANGLGPDSPMKGTKNLLKPSDIWNVINYVRSLGPAPAAP